MANQSKHCYYCGWRLHLVGGWWYGPSINRNEPHAWCDSQEKVKLHVPEAVAKATARKLQSTDQPVTTEG